MERLTAPRFSEAPFTLAWEITRACALQCRHCRATAQRRRDAQELTTEEGFHLVDQVADMGTVVLVVTGGDPLMRPDVYDLIGRGAARGLRVAFSPSATGLANAEALRRAREAGVHMVHVSLDGATAATHDGFRRVHGSYGRTLRMLEDLREMGVPLQVGTTVSRYSWKELPAIAALVAAAGARVWSVFFLVPTGRALAEDMVSPRQHEVAYRWLAGLSGRVAYRVRTTAAPAYRRVVMQRSAGKVAGAPLGRPGSVMAGAGYDLGRMGVDETVNDGKGFCFVDHVGNVCPSGFLPLVAGNVRETPLAQVYRHSTLFRALRDPSLLQGKCGICGFKEACGGSRGRAYALSGDYLAADPSCVYQPAGWGAAVESGARGALAVR